VDELYDIYAAQEDAVPGQLSRDLSVNKVSLWHEWDKTWMWFTQQPLTMHLDSFPTQFYFRRNSLNRMRMRKQLLRRSTACSM
jgi:hypothetical protein